MNALGNAREIRKSPVLRTLIDDLLAEQKKLQTPVARFAEIHDREPDLAAHYRNLIPLTAPGPGEQYAFEVSLDRCTSCKACVAACAPWSATLNSSTPVAALMRRWTSST